MCNFVQKILCFFEFGIAEACVIDHLEFLNEDRLGVGYIAEGDGALLEITFCHLGVDESVDEFADGLLCVVGK